MTWREKTSKMRFPNASTLEGVAAAVSEAAAPQGAPEKAAVLYRGALSELASIRTATATPRNASNVAEGKVVKGVEHGGGGGSGGRARVEVGARVNVRQRGRCGGARVAMERLQTNRAQEPRFLARRAARRTRIGPGERA